MDTFEKAYKASLETAKQWIEDGCSVGEQICLECVFPELRESEDLEEAASKYATDDNNWFIEEEKLAFKAGAEWQKKQTPMPEDTVLFNKGVEEGKRLIMEGAVEGEVVKDISNKLAVTAKGINLDGFKFGQKVRIIILPKEYEQ